MPAAPMLAGSRRRARRAVSAVLGSPIILYDYPEIAGESTGSLFDATEIDEILMLRVLTMTDAEKAEARATDPKAAEIIERRDAMSTETHRDYMARSAIRTRCHHRGMTRTTPSRFSMIMIRTPAR